MVGEDLEKEKQKANEELKVLLKDMVVGPVDAVVQAAFEKKVFSLSSSLQGMLKSVAKSNSLRDLSDKLDDKADEVIDQIKDDLDRLSRSAIERCEDLKVVIMANALSASDLRREFKGDCDRLRHDIENISSTINSKSSELSSQLLNRYEQDHVAVLDQLMSLVGLMKKVEEVWHGKVDEVARLEGKLDQYNTLLNQRYGEVSKGISDTNQYLDRIQEGFVVHQEKLNKIQKSVVIIVGGGMAFMTLVVAIATFFVGQFPR